MNLWLSSQISQDEKNDILSKHRHIYDGYKTMNPEVSNTQPLYVQDFAKDKGGMVVNNKGNVKSYTNFGINEQVESKEVCDECGAMEMSEGQQTCNECGGMMTEGECSECGWKGDDLMEFDELEENIYDIEDLNPEEGFDYLEPKGSNKIDTFKLRKEQGTNYDEIEPAYDFESDGPGDVYPVAEEDDFEMYEPMESAWADDLDEVDVSGSQGVYSDMDPAYDFDSDGPGSAGPYQRSSYNEDEELEDEEELDEFWQGAAAAGLTAAAVPIGTAIGNKIGGWISGESVDEDLMEGANFDRLKITNMMNRMNIL
jgi:hypothetical protein